MIIGGFMEKNRIEELVKYYSTSIEILEGVLESNESISQDYIDKSNMSISLFKDTVVCLKQLLNTYNT
jgi:hypothetical protein